MMILDANTWLGHWPFDDLEPDTSRELVARQASVGIQLSSVASIDAVFYRDPMSANRRLFRELRSHPTLEPVAVLNPSLPHWRDALDFYVEQHGCRQLRLVPNYHNYLLSDPAVDELIAAARDRGVRVGVQVRLEDERAHHPLFSVPGVATEQLAGLAGRWPDEPFLLFCCYLGEARALAGQGNLLFGISHLEYLDTLNHVLQMIPASRLVLASHTPFLVTRAALEKVRACTAPEAERAAIAGGNLAEWLSGQRDDVPWLKRELV